jgi:hypothetical protein
MRIILDFLFRNKKTLIVPAFVLAIYPQSAWSDETIASEEGAPTNMTENNARLNDASEESRPGAEADVESNASVPSELAGLEWIDPKGGRVTLPEKGFSMQIPIGWKYRKDLPRTTLFMRPEKLKEGDYPRNVSVLRFSEPMVINSTSAEKFSNFLVKNFPSASAEIADFKLRNYEEVKMNDDRPALLIYTDFLIGSKPMMQAHVLVSSQTAHYLVSYTDQADNFETPQGISESFATIWESMTSIELDSASPQILEGFQWWIYLGGIVLLVAGGFGFYRYRTANSLYNRYTAMDPGEAALVDPKTKANSQIDSKIESQDPSSLTLGMSGLESQEGKVITFASKALRKMTQKKNKWDIEAESVDDSSKSEADEDVELPQDKWKVG